MNAKGSSLYTACDALGAWCCCIERSTLSKARLIKTILIPQTDWENKVWPNIIFYKLLLMTLDSDAPTRFCNSSMGADFILETEPNFFSKSFFFAGPMPGISSNADL